MPERGSPLRFTNHSCFPNAIVSEGFAVVAFGDIPPGGEVLLDYSTTEVDPGWRLRCHCKSSHCRGLVRSFPFLPEPLRALYATPSPRVPRRRAAGGANPVRVGLGAN
jgi:hypothetical protein